MRLLDLVNATAKLDGRTVLDGVSMSLSEGELVALVGPNGAGKSSAIQALAGLLPLTRGQALLAGDDINRLSSRDRGRRLSYLPQERRIAWNMPALEVAALGAPFLAASDALSRARAALDAVEAGHLADRGVAEMSGGERARVLLARALTVEAPALLADEPTAGLDPEAQLMVMQVLRRRADSGQAVLVSVHDLTLAAGFADRVVVVHGGRIAANAPPLQAMSPTILAEVFGLQSQWSQGPAGPLLAAQRYSDGSAGGVERPLSPAK